MRKIGCMLAAVCLCFGLASCSEDEGEGGGSNTGKNSVRLGNKTFKTPYGYWHSGAQDSEASVDDNLILMEFYSYNPTSGKFPGKASVVGIEYEAPKGQKEITSTVLKGGEYHIYVAHDVTMSSEGLQCETYDNDTSNPDLKIVRNGSTYSISVEGATVSDENQNYDFSFNFSGKLTNRQIAE